MVFVNLLLGFAEQDAVRKRAERAGYLRIDGQWSPVNRRMVSDFDFAIRCRLGVYLKMNTEMLGGGDKLSVECDQFCKSGRKRMAGAQVSDALVTHID